MRFHFALKLEKEIAFFLLEIGAPSICDIDFPIVWLLLPLATVVNVDCCVEIDFSFASAIDLSNESRINLLNFKYLAGIECK